MAIKVFTHTDLDGFGCGMLFEVSHGDFVNITYTNYSDVDMEIYDFIKSKDYNSVDKIFICDMSISDDLCKWIDKYGDNKFMLIDHHINKKTEHLNKYRWCIRQGTKSDGSMCSATWLVNEYVIKSQDKFIKDIVNCIDDYDTWNYTLNGNSKAKQLNDIYYILGRDRLTEIIWEQYYLDGNSHFKFNSYLTLLLKIRDEEYDRYFKSQVKNMTITKYNGYNIGVCFADKYISELGNDIFNTNPKVDIVAIVNLKQNTVSLRTGRNDIHLGELASTLGVGGGGHKASAGFPLPTDFRKLILSRIFPQ